MHELQPLMPIPGCETYLRRTRRKRYSRTMAETCPAGMPNMPVLRSKPPGGFHCGTCRERISHNLSYPREAGTSQPGKECMRPAQRLTPLCHCGTCPHCILCTAVVLPTADTAPLRSCRTFLAQSIFGWLFFSVKYSMIKHG